MLHGLGERAFLGNEHFFRYAGRGVKGCGKGAEGAAQPLGFRDVGHGDRLLTIQGAELQPGLVSCLSGQEIEGAGSLDHAGESGGRSWDKGWDFRRFSVLKNAGKHGSYEMLR